MKHAKRLICIGVLLVLVFWLVVLYPAEVINCRADGKRQMSQYFPSHYRGTTYVSKDGSMRLSNDGNATTIFFDNETSLEFSSCGSIEIQGATYDFLISESPSSPQLVFYAASVEMVVQDSLTYEEICAQYLLFDATVTRADKDGLTLIVEYVASTFPLQTGETFVLVKTEQN